MGRSGFSNLPGEFARNTVLQLAGGNRHSFQKGRIAEMAAKQTATNRKKSPAKKPASKKSASTRVSAARQEEMEHSRRQLWAVLLFALGILFFFITLIPGEKFWLWMHRGLFGLLGWCAFLIAPILIYVAVMGALEKPGGKIENKIWQMAVLVLLICGATHVFATKAGDDLGFWAQLGSLYERGVHLKGGGLCSALIGVPLMALLGKVPAAITILVLIFVMLMVLTGGTLLDLARSASKPVKKLEAAYIEKTQERQASPKFDPNIPVDDALSPDEEGMPQHPVRSPKLTLDTQSIQKSKHRLLDLAHPKPKNNIQEPPIELQEDTTETPPAPQVPEQTQEPVPEPPDNELEELISRLTIAEPPESPDPAQAPILDDADASDLSLEDLVLEDKTQVPGEAAQEKLEEAIRQVQKDASLAPQPPEYHFPAVELLKFAKPVSEDNVGEELRLNAERLVSTLKSFGVQTKIVDVTRGPTVTRYELQPSAGVKISKITSLADDIALNLAAAGVRIEAPIPNKPAVGIEVPNKVVGTVSIREIIDSPEFRDAKSKLTVSLGRDIAGKVSVMDLAKMPHMLIAGATGSGKSVCINSIIVSLLYKSTPSQVRLLMVDPKVVELGIYNGIPHLLVPVVTDPRKAAGALNWAVNEMLKRYKTFADNSVRDLTGYNRLAQEREDLEPMPQIVIIIDELADLMMAAPDEVEDAICRLAQMARAAGMHLVIATQRPSVDVITGVIKANIPSRIAFTVSSQVDSRTILDSGGAEKLLGRGDMLFAPVGAPKPLRVQGCFVSDKEVEDVVEFIKNGSQEPASYDEAIMDEIERQAVAEKSSSGDGGGFAEDDPMLNSAIECVVEAGQASTSMLQRRLKLGYARAARLVDDMEVRGIVGPYEGSKPRSVLITRQQWMERKLNTEE